MKLTIAYDTLKALLMIAAKKDIRYYLMGVCIDVRASDVTLVATDGNVMLAVPVEETDVEEPTPGQYIVDRLQLEAVKPSKVGRESLPITITIGEEGACSVAGATTSSGKLIDGTYPAWRRPIPATVSGEAGQFDPDLLAIFADVRRLLCGVGKDRPILHHNGSSSALVSNLGANAIGVIAPMRHTREKLELPSLPTWARRLDA